MYALGWAYRVHCLWRRPDHTARFGLYTFVNMSPLALRRAAQRAVPVWVPGGRHPCIRIKYNSTHALSSSGCNVTPWELRAHLRSDSLPPRAALGIAQSYLWLHVAFPGVSSSDLLQATHVFNK